MILGRRSPREACRRGDGIRVFGIGMGRTGTRSLQAALNMLGWHCLHQPEPGAMISGEFERALQGYEAATDSSVAVCFRGLAEAYPDSKFILTVRDHDAWIRSCAKKFSTPPKDSATLRLRELLYGGSMFDEETWLRAAKDHVRAVLKYFSLGQRRKRLLIMNITSGADGWHALCKFLLPFCPQLALIMPPRDFPRVTTHSAFLRAAYEFADNTRKIGLVRVRHGRIHYGAEHTNEWHSWVRRKLLIVVTQSGSVSIYVFRRPSTNLFEWEAAFRLSPDVIVCMHRLQQIRMAAPRVNMPEYELRVEGLIGDTAQQCTLHFGCGDIQQLSDWAASILAGRMMAAGKPIEIGPPLRVS